MKYFWCFVTLAAVAFSNEVHGASYYVSPVNGRDNGPGTQVLPFRTLQKCVDVATEAGDVCVLRAARYNESVFIKGASALTIESFPGEVAIIDGTADLSYLEWSNDGDSRQCVYRSSQVPRNETVAWQLWMDEATPLTPARWPNARLDDLSVFTPLAQTNGSGPFAFSAISSSFGHLIDDGTHVPSLSDSGIDFTGAYVVLPLGTMGADPQGCRVTKHGTGASSLSYDPPTGSKASLHANNPYFFEGHPKLLDAEAEWSWDAKRRQFLVWLPKCADPRNISLRGKVKNFNINVTRSDVTFRNIVFFATTFGAVSSGLMIDNVTMMSPTFNSRTIDGGSAAETWLNIAPGKSSVLTIRDSSLRTVLRFSTDTGIMQNS